MTERSARDILVEARDLIDRVGWNQGDYQEHDFKGNVLGFCAYGAINEIAGFPVELGYCEIPENSADPVAVAMNTMESVAESKVEQNEEVYGSKLVQYNDTVASNKQNVLDLFDEAIRSIDE